ncbi:MAG: response regulator [bacterium]|nr:response regulator [bacterium]
MSKRNLILIADDEAPLRRSIKRQLHKLEVDVIEAGDGAEALKLATEHLPDLILLDVMMPGMDGFEVCRRLRAQSELSQCYIIFLSARDRVVDRATGLREGANDYLVKPFVPEELVEQIAAGLQIANQTRQATREPLTGLFNRHYFMQRIGEERIRQSRYRSDYSILLIEAVYKPQLKTETEIDQARVLIAQMLLRQSRKTDLVARIDDDLFALLMPATRRGGSKVAALRLQEYLCNHLPDQALAGLRTGLGSSRGGEAFESAQRALSLSSIIHCDHPN